MLGIIPRRVLPLLKRNVLMMLNMNLPSMTRMAMESAAAMEVGPTPSGMMEPKRQVAGALDLVKLKSLEERAVAPRYVFEILISLILFHLMFGCSSIVFH